MSNKSPADGTNLDGKILAGARGNAHTNLQCMSALTEIGFHAVLGRDPKTGECVVSLFKGDELKKAAGGATYPVAFRRLFEGASEILPGKIVE